MKHFKPDGRCGRPRRGWYKLTPSTVATIRRFALERGWSYHALAERYGVHPTHICHIVHYRRWKEVA